MNLENLILTLLLKAAIMDRPEMLQGDTIASYLPSDTIARELAVNSIPWDRVYEEAKKHQVHSLVYPMIPYISDIEAPAKNLLENWKQDTLFIAKEQINHIHEICQLFQQFHDANISAMGLKGIVLRDNYPTPELRSMTDADILIRPEDSPMVHEILTRNQYIRSSSSQKHDIYSRPGYLNVEIHYSVLDPHILPRSQAFPIQIWRNTNFTLLNGTPILTLSRENQILHLTIHMASHYISGGFGLRQLCDLMLFAHNHYDIIDWNYVYHMASDYDLVYFMSVSFYTLQKLFNFTIPEPFVDNTIASSRNMNLFIADILDGGVYGKSSLDRIHSSTIAHYIHLDSSRSFGFKQKLQFIFPPTYKLRSYYGYCKKVPILLPIAWIHRILRNIFKIDKWSILRSSKKKHTSTIENRYGLIQWLKLNS